MHDDDDSERAAEQLVDELLRDAHRALVLRAFCELNVANHFAAEPTTLHELSMSVGAPAASLVRRMRAAVPMGLCREHEEEAYSLTRAGEMFRDSAAGGAAEWATLLTAPWILRAWEQLGSAIRDNRSYFADVHGVGFWAYVAQHPDEAGVFDSMMTVSAAGRAEDLHAALDWV